MTRGIYGTQRGRPGYAGRGTYGHHLPVVGISLWHTVGDRDRAVEEVNTMMVMIVSELLAKMGVDPDVFKPNIAAWTRDPVGQKKRMDAAFAHMRKSRLYPIWAHTVSPIYEEWKAFYADQSDWEEWKTSWETYEHWVDRVKSLRDSVNQQLARFSNDRLHTPDTGNLPTTLPGSILDTTGDVIKTVGHGAKEGASDIWGMVKFGVYGGLAIAGILAASSIVQQLRHNRDPFESYVAMARGRRR